ncbi:hypothetical protein Zmor_006970 [Zophobas morio]|uniref:Uncharacterized protein n=1 Tax=Zophobas morio TaxID=2755281 RepID=A0AA38MN54_9CUCU|nr:hypothetical protein Zmor_006970 [Zophobas morio]
MNLMKAVKAAESAQLVASAASIEIQKRSLVPETTVSGANCNSNLWQQKLQCRESQHDAITHISQLEPCKRTFFKLPERDPPTARSRQTRLRCNK